MGRSLIPFSGVLLSLKPAPNSLRKVIETSKPAGKGRAGKRSSIIRSDASHVRRATPHGLVESPENLDPGEAATSGTQMEWCPRCLPCFVSRSRETLRNHHCNDARHRRERLGPPHRVSHDVRRIRLERNRRRTLDVPARTNDDPLCGFTPPTWIHLTLANDWYVSVADLFTDVGFELVPLVVEFRELDVGGSVTRGDRQEAQHAQGEPSHHALARLEDQRRGSRSLCRRLENSRVTAVGVEELDVGLGCDVSCYQSSEETGRPSCGTPARGKCQGEYFRRETSRESVRYFCEDTYTVEGGRIVPPVEPWRHCRCRHPASWYVRTANELELAIRARAGDVGLGRYSGTQTPVVLSRWPLRP